MMMVMMMVMMMIEMMIMNYDRCCVVDKY